RSVLTQFSAPPPPRATLFPYTTLFRSAGGLRTRRKGHPAASGQRLCGGCPHGLGSAKSDRPQRDGGRFGSAGPSKAPAVSLRPVDRKSTRLNSSHLVISYAVFCLKKKN